MMDDGQADNMEQRVEHVISNTDDLVWIVERMITSNISNNNKITTTVTGATESIREQ